MTVVELVLAVHDVLDHAGSAHAFGGALALAYYAEPRGTLDVDVNVFAPFTEAAEVVKEFESLGLAAARPPEQWLPVAGVRLSRTGEPVALDLFFSLDEHYDEISRRSQLFPFGPSRRVLPFLSAEDLAVFKLSFGRDKDWVDLRQLARRQPPLDIAYIGRQLLAIRGPTMNPRLARLRSLIRG